MASVRDVKPRFLGFYFFLLFFRSVGWTVLLITRKDHQITTLCTPCTTPSVTLVRNDKSAHAHGIENRVRNSRNFKTSGGLAR